MEALKVYTAVLFAVFAPSSRNLETFLCRLVLVRFVARLGADRVVAISAALRTIFVTRTI